MSDQKKLFDPTTKNGYRLDEVTSSLQKEIRRQNTESLLKEIILGIVSEPESVETYLSTEKDEKGEIFIINVKVAKHDIGACIGKRGETAEAIRKIIGLIGFQQTGKRYYVKIDAPKIHKNHFEFET
ncbi:MAG: KH domain-containing protein [Patescibacteria group bacterium]|nr:KH domain-containing protein [Patescibacteria group bacterium]